MLIAKIYVEKTVYHIDTTFKYIVPDDMSTTLKRGCRVLVPFGIGNKKVQGICVEVYDEDVVVIGQLGYKLKPIFMQIDEQPEIDEEMFALIEFLVKTTFCTYYDALKTIIPAGENARVKVGYSLTRELYQHELDDMPKQEREICLALRVEQSNGKKDKSDKELKTIIGVASISKSINSLINKGIVTKSEVFDKVSKSKTKELVTLNTEVEQMDMTFTAKQLQVVETIKQQETATIKELAYLSGVSEAIVRNLVKRNILTKFTVRVNSSYAKKIAKEVKNFSIELSQKQTEVFNGILDLVKEDTPNTSLLFGITGSGKTQVYIKLIEEVVAMGKTAILLVPEIALTPQLLSKFESYFGDNIAVIHSNLSVSERLTTYKRIRIGNVSIVIGARSAVFAPLKNLGIIILDEEGEGSYKSDAAPRYHARAVAKFRCHDPNNNASLVLGSATPSIDSYNNAVKDKYHLFVLEERFANAQIPDVYIVDMLAEQKQNNFSPLSVVLVEQLRLNLEAGEQSMLLINRRGFNTFATCLECDEVVKCKNCDVSMTYHKANGFMMCHYCGNSEPVKIKCPFCGGSHIKLTGVGTQRLENELETYLPNARILRMDSDTTGGRHSYEDYFDDFKNNKYDIMVGTQMIAKGLDFPNVTLVGVLNADSGLYSTDYKASERVFSLITQVIGRSGRSEKPGRAYIQTMDLENSTINYASNQDYEAFFKDEIFTRKALKLPPFCTVVVFAFTGEKEDVVSNAAHKALDIMHKNALTFDKLALHVLGVSRANVYKINNKFRYRMVIKCKLNNQMRALISKTLVDCGSDDAFVGVSIVADVNGDI